MKNSTAIIIAALILSGTWYLTSRDSSQDGGDNSKNLPTMNFPKGMGPRNGGSDTASSPLNSTIKDGVQYVTIEARGGYSPRSSRAKAGTPTKLIMKTNGAYDCSTSLVIRSLNYRGSLPSTGETMIDAGTPKSGDVLQGVCGMGMYSFEVKFE